MEQRTSREEGTSDLRVMRLGKNGIRAMLQPQQNGAETLVEKWSTTTVIYCRKRNSRQLFSVIEAGVMESPSMTVFKNCRNKLFYDMK